MYAYKENEIHSIMSMCISATLMAVLTCNSTIDQSYNVTEKAITAAIATLGR